MEGKVYFPYRSMARKVGNTNFRTNVRNNKNRTDYTHHPNQETRRNNNPPRTHYTNRKGNFNNPPNLSQENVTTKKMFFLESRRGPRNPKYTTPPWQYQD